MLQKLKTVRGVLLIGLVMGCMSFFTAHVQASEDIDPYTKAYAEIWNISIAEAENRIYWSSVAESLHVGLKTNDSDTFAGAWIQHEPEFRFVVAFNTSNPSEIIDKYPVAQELGEYLKVVQHPISREILLNTQSNIHLQVRELEFNISSYIDSETNTIIVETMGNPEELIQLLGDIPEYIKVVEGDFSFQSETTIDAGRDIGSCSSGFIIIADDNVGTTQNGILTAGHCSGASLSYGGYGFSSLDPARDSSNRDFWPIQNNDPNEVYKDHARTTTSSSVAIRGETTVAQNEVVCVFGGQTETSSVTPNGYRCAPVTDTNASYDDHSGFIRVQRTDYEHLTMGGDSGSPWFLARSLEDSGSRYYAAGVHSAGESIDKDGDGIGDGDCDNPCENYYGTPTHETAVFMPIGNIRSYNVQLDTLYTSYSTSYHRVYISWVDHVDSNSNFEISRRKVDDSVYQPIDTVGTDTTYVYDYTVTCDEKYIYRVVENVTSGTDRIHYSGVVDTTCNIFSDTPGDHPSSFETWMEELYHRDITTGCNSGTPGVDLEYCPDVAVSRGAMAVFLLRAIAYPNSHSVSGREPDPFIDVPDTSQPPFFESWIEDFYDLGITTGCNGSVEGVDLEYCPTLDVTRGAMAVFILRSLYGSGYTPTGLSTNPLEDVVGHPFEKWIEDFYDLGITTGINDACPDGTPPPSPGKLNYCPDDAVTRGAMAVFILRAFDSIPDPDDP